MRETFGATFLDADVALAGGVEDTRESAGLLGAAEALAAAAWGAERCFFLVNGSTSGVHSLVLTLAGPDDHVIVPRNSHKSLLAALIFSGAMPQYVEPTVDPEWGIPLNISDEKASAALAARPDAKAFFVTSPTYNGFGADLAHLAGRHARGRHAADRRPSLGTAPALLHEAADRRHVGRGRRRRHERAQAHQRPHAVVGASGARRAPQPRAGSRAS